MTSWGFVAGTSARHVQIILGMLEQLICGSPYNVAHQARVELQLIAEPSSSSTRRARARR
jgi:hypothetical protein